MTMILRLFVQHSVNYILVLESLLIYLYGHFYI
jgi:hypothetical protein